MKCTHAWCFCGYCVPKNQKKTNEDYIEVPIHLEFNQNAPIGFVKILKQHTWKISKLVLSPGYISKEGQPDGLIYMGLITGESYNGAIAKRMKEIIKKQLL